MRKRWKRIMIISFTLLFCFLIIVFIILTRIPVKYAVKIDEINQYKNSILVKETWHTGTGWEKVGDESGFLPVEKIEDVHLIGKIPPTADIGGDHVNIFLCVVKYSGKYALQNSSVLYDEYEITEWYPLYPIKRDTILPSWIYPKGYYSICDNINNN